MDVQALILECSDNPDWVHRLLRALLERKLRFIEESLKGAKFDLIETGGGAASDTVISPELHREFCLPYDRQVHDALHSVGHKATYHTCGGMMHILDQVVENGADASETLAPPGVGGNIADPARVRQAYGGKVAMIGGMDQFNILTGGTSEEIRAEVSAPPPTTSSPRPRGTSEPSRKLPGGACTDVTVSIAIAGVSTASSPGGPFHDLRPIPLFGMPMSLMSNGQLGAE
jgi:hypothetical protein